MMSGAPPAMDEVVVGGEANTYYPRKI